MSKEIFKQKCIVGVAPQGDPHSIKTTPEYVGAGLVPARNENNNGITLVALIITIIIMLILVGVSVTVSIDGGLFKTAKDAVNETEIFEEKELIEKAYILANIGGGIQVQRFRTCLEDAAGAENIELSALGDEFEVYFKKSKRVYPVDKYGNIGDYETPVEVNNTRKDKYDITKNGALDGVENPYEINCIEDLVALSYNTNGITVQDDGTLGTATNNNYSGKEIVLTKNLNFKSKYSYENSDRTDYGDVNGNGTVEKLITELTTGKGWLPIGGYNSKLFAGTFNGKGNAIKNLYINNVEATTYNGLFGGSRGATIENLGVEGNIYCNSEVVGGIIAGSGFVDATKKIEKCYFKGEIENVRETSSYTGGIVGNGGTQGSIDNCYSSGKVVGKNETGGLAATVGSANNSYNSSDVEGGIQTGGIIGASAGNIYNCYNTGSISGTTYVGGIKGYGAGFIENCYNNGNITATTSYAGGIIGMVNGGTGKRIYQCYNTGKISGASIVGGISGFLFTSTNNSIEQCYNTGEITGTTNTSGISGGIHGNNNKILNCYNTGKVNGTNIAGIGISNTTTKIVSCYNIGELNANTKYGISNSGVISNSYYLQGCGATDTLATAKSAADLKTMHGTLDKKFTIDDTANTVTIIETENQNVWGQDTGNINKGYPILKWQTEQ